MSAAALERVDTPGLPGENHRGWSLLLVVVIVGMALRVSCYLANRSLWGDEAALALNIVPRGFWELGRPLGQNQHASLGFRWLLKIATLAISPDAYGLRFPPMAASVLSMPIVALIARRLLERVPALIAIALFAINPWLIAYAAECKAYSIEIMAAALTTWLALRVMDCADPTPRLVTLGVATAALSWLGAGTAFIVGGAWIVVTLWVMANRRGGRIRAACLVCGAAVFASTLASVWITRLDPKVLQFQLDAWAELDAWPPAPWKSWNAAAWYPQAVVRFFHQVGGFSAAYLALALLVIGTVSLARRRPWPAALLLAPAVLVLIAGCLHLYPLTGMEWSGYLPSSSRLLLFLTPSISILIAAGIGALSTEWPHRGSFAGLVLFAILIANPLATTVQRAIRPPRFQDMRSAWQAIAGQIQAGDAVYVNPGATTALMYYARLFPAPVRFPWLTGQKPSDIGDWLDRLQSRGQYIHRMWFILVWYKEWYRENLPSTQASLAQALPRNGRWIERREDMDFPDIHVCVYTLGHHALK